MNQYNSYSPHNTAHYGICFWSQLRYIWFAYYSNIWGIRLNTVADSIAVWLDFWSASVVSGLLSDTKDKWKSSSSSSSPSRHHVNTYVEEESSRIWFRIRIIFISVVIMVDIVGDLIGFDIVELIVSGSRRWRWHISKWCETNALATRQLSTSSPHKWQGKYRSSILIAHGDNMGVVLVECANLHIWIWIWNVIRLVFPDGGWRAEWRHRRWYGRRRWRTDWPRVCAEVHANR